MSDTIETTNRKMYLPRHVWVQVDGNGRLAVGVTTAGLEALNGLAYATLPGIGDEAVAGETVMSLEGRKAVEDVTSPASGIVAAFDQGAVDDPDNFQFECDVRPLIVLTEWDMPFSIASKLKDTEDTEEEE